MVSVLSSAVKRTRARVPKSFVIVACFVGCWIVLITCRFSLLERRSASVTSFHTKQTTRRRRRRRSGVLSWLWSSHCAPDRFVPVMDIVAVGSLSRNPYAQAQQDTFGRHRFVRDFYSISERNDTDATCATELTMEQRRQVLDFCTHGDRSTQTFETFYFRTDLFGPTSEKTGWLCAQKRPIDGLNIALERYKAGVPLPDYVLIIDDDTYLNIDALAETFQQHYPPEENHVVAGCTYRRPGVVDFVFPVGGVGSFLTKGAIEKLLTPLHCASPPPGGTKMDAFTRWACWRLQLDPVGEKAFFHDGMSIGDLMYAYAAQLPFTGVAEWNRTGYCFHSDHTLGYFLNYYHVAVPDRVLEETRPNDEIRKQYPVQTIAGSREKDHNGRGGDCDNLWEKCTRKSRICHYTNPEQMKRIYQRQAASC
jgi:hypothetical protein